MLSLIVGALVGHRAQALWIAVLTMMSVAGAAAAPWYHLAALDSVTATDIAAAPVSQRVVIVWGRYRPGPDQDPPIPRLRREVSPLVDLPHAPTVLGEQGLVRVAGSRELGVQVAYREGMCEHLDIVGACPAAADQVVLGATMAAQLGVVPGDTVGLTGSGRRVPFTVVGVYRPTGLDGTYWVETGLLANPASYPAGQFTSPHGDAVFTTDDGVRRVAPQVLDVSYHVVVPDRDLADRSGDGFAGRLAASEAALTRSGYITRTTADSLARLIGRDRNLAAGGIGVVAAQVVLLGWFCLYLAVRHTAADRRRDLGMLKLQGTARWRTVALVMLPVAVPMLAGAAVGWVLGYLVARALVRGWPDAAVPMVNGPTATLSMAAAALAVLVALAVAAVAEARALATPVTDLLRRVPARRSGWRAGLFDLTVVVLAAVAVYQSTVETGDRTPLARLAPGLLVLALGLVAARTVPPVAARVGAAALRTGRPGLALAALHLARRTGMRRLLAMLVVAVGLLGYAAVAWHTSTAASTQRAQQEIGAARVLSVHAGGPDQLLSAVRRADPDGRYAMAVVRTTAMTTIGRVLAVDSPRLARVAVWPRTYGGTASDVARTLRPAPLRGVDLTDGTYTLRAAADEPATVAAVVARPDGERVTLSFGSIDGTPVSASLSGCPPTSACRLVGWRCQCPAVTLHRLDGPSGTVVAPAEFGDTTRWRPGASSRGFGTIISATDDRLTLTRSSNPAPGNPPLDPDPVVYVADSPVPLPVVLAGAKRPADRVGDDRVAPVGLDDLPFRVAARVDALPRVGTNGALVDLESATRAGSTPGRDAAFQVWLTEDAPQSIVDGLTAGGLSVIRSESVAGAAGHYARQGPAAALRYELFGALLAVLLAAGSVMVVGASERAHRAAELAALRAQGLPVPALRVTAYVGPVLLPLVAAPIGVLACLLGLLVVDTATPTFTDGWRVLPVRTVPVAVPLGIAAVLTFLAFAGPGLLHGRRVTRAIGRSRGGAP